MKQMTDEEKKLLKVMILEYEPENPDKTLQLILKTQEFIEKHFEVVIDGKKVKPLTYTQLRNILLEIKKHDQNLARVIPTLAYIEAKLDEENQKDLVRFIRELLHESMEKGKKNQFLEFMMMLVAFHRNKSSIKNK